MSAVEEVRGSAERYADPRWYTPSPLPATLEAFDTPVAHLAVGSPGKVGMLDLKLAPVAGATRVVHQFQKMPLYLYFPMYIDPGRPDMAFLFLMQGGEGLLQGDRYRVDIDCAPGAAVHVTTQAATKIFRMEDNFATQLVQLSAGAGAYVEYLPDPVIPFRDARFYQRISLTADPTASAILGETLLPGRVARGEAHAYTLYHTDLEVSAPDGKLLFADRVVLAPSERSVRSAGRLGPYDVLATLYVVTRQLPPRVLVDILRDALSEALSEAPSEAPSEASEAQPAALDGVLGGVSALPNGTGAVVRLLGPSSIPVKRALRRAWSAARLALIGVPAPDLRKG